MMRTKNRIVELENEVPSLVRGGPVWRFERFLGLLGPDGLPTWSGAVKLTAFCWLPMVLLACLDSRNWTLAHGHSFFSDLDVYSRSLLAVFILMITDRTTDHRLNNLLITFEKTGIISSDMHAGYMRQIIRGDRRTSSAVAETIILFIAVALSGIATYFVINNDLEQWNTAMPGLSIILSPAGWWKTLVSDPIYYLLTFRWLWRLIAWTLLMKDITSLPLQLVATHPDKAGGLGFLTIFPAMFLPLIFSLSMVFATGNLQIILIQGGQVIDLEYAVFGWLTLVLIFFVGPLGVFTPQLLQLKERAIVEYGALIASTNRSAEAQLLDKFANGQAVDKDTISMIADISACLETIKALKPVPVEFFALIPLIVSALLPLLAVAATKLPIGDLLWNLFTSVI